MTESNPGADGTIYILLPVHERRAVTEAFVRCLLAQTDQGYHLVLIDDGSSDGTAAGVSELLPATTVLRGNGSWWWAGSLQQGQRWLARRGPGTSDLVLIANDDTRFDVDFLARGRAAMTGAPKRLLLAQLYDGASGAFIELGVHVDWRRLKFKGVTDPARVNCQSTRGLFLAASEFVALGGFHPRLLPHYLSDHAFTIRAARRGYELASDPGVRLWYDATTTGVRVVSRASVGAYLRSTLTRRSVANPVYWSTFVFLTSPRRRVPANLFRVWKRYIAGLDRARRGGTKPR